MLRSMTGFGKAVREFDGATITLEVSSVNHRYMDCSFRLPGAWAATEPALKQVMRDCIGRGKLYVTVSCRRGAESARPVVFNAEQARRYMDSAEQLRAMMGTDDRLSLDLLAQLEGVFVSEDPEEDLERVEAELLATLREALDMLQRMREREGAALAKDVTGRIQSIRGYLERVEATLPELTRAYEERLRSRIEELQLDSNVTEERLAVEVAFLADKGDVAEEVTRLKVHLDHAEEMLAGDDAVGRRLDFLAQEIQREINTLGVKVRDSAVAREVLEMKSELEKLREQVQNIE